METQWWLTAAVSVLTLFSGICWIRSAMARVVHDNEKRDSSGMKPMAIVDDSGKAPMDVLETAKLQSWWNTRAAWLAGCAALVQTASSFMSL